MKKVTQREIRDLEEGKNANFNKLDGMAKKKILSKFKGKRNGRGK